MGNKKIKLLQIERLVDIIQSMNNAIQLHLGADKPDRLAIEQYRYWRGFFHVAHNFRLKRDAAFIGF